MHRFLRPQLLPWGGVFVALLIMAWPSSAPGQEPSPQPSALIVPINGTVKLQMSKKQKIKTVINPKENAVSLRTLQNDPTTVLVIGQQPDVTRIELEDTDGNKETYEVIVQADVEYLRTQLRRAVPTASVTVIPLANNNTVILTGTVTRAEDVAVIRGLVQNMGFKYVDGMRVGGVQQVQLDVIIVQVSRSDLRNLTFNFLGSSRYATGGSTIGSAVTNPASVGGPAGGSSGGSGGGAGGSTGGLGISAGSAPAGVPASGTNLLLGFVHNAWGFNNFLEALKENGLAKLLAEPRLVTLSGRPAYFLVGGQQAVPVAGGFSGVGVQFVPFGTTLSFIPIVLGNGRIYLEVSPSVSSLDAASGVTPAGGGPVPGRAINSVTTTVELESGQTFVLGGLIQHTVQASVSKVPCLGDLPWLGMFFRSMQYQDNEQEVLIIVTPWLVDALSCSQRPKILPGEETRKPDNFELFLEGIIEAPRGPRQTWQQHHYVPAWMNSPSAATFPCAGKGNCGVPAGDLPAAPAGTEPAPLPPGVTPTPLPATSAGSVPAAPAPSGLSGSGETPPPPVNDPSASAPERGGAG
jgi:pilus assembly protein CpaC